MSCPQRYLRACKSGRRQKSAASIQSTVSQHEPRTTLQANNGHQRLEPEFCSGAGRRCERWLFANRRASLSATGRHGTVEQGSLHEWSATLKHLAHRSRGRTASKDCQQGGQIRRRNMPSPQAMVSAANDRRQLRWACHIDQYACGCSKGVERSCQSVTSESLIAAICCSRTRHVKQRYIKSRAVFAKQAALKKHE